MSFVEQFLVGRFLTTFALDLKSLIVLGIFRTNQLWNTFLFVFYALLVRVYCFFAPVDVTRGGEAYISNYLLVAFPEGLLGNIIASCCIILQAILLTWIVARHRLDKEVTLFSGVFYLLFSSIIWWFFPMSPVLLSNFFLILALNELLSTYRKKSCADIIFNAGFLIGLASLFYPSQLIMILLGFMAISNLRSINLKEFAIFLIGFFSVYFLAAVYHFWNDQLLEFLSFVAQSYRIGDLFRLSFDLDTIVVFGAFAILTLVAVFNLNNYTQGKNIHAQKAITILYQLLFLGILGLFIQKEIYLRIDHFLILAIPLSILISFNFANMRNKAAASSLHLVLLAAVLLFHFKNLI